MNADIVIEYTPWVRSASQTPEGPLPQRGASPSQDLLGNRDFFAGKSLPELAREQGVGPVKDIRVFAGGFPEYEDLDELLAELDQIRGS
jgi:hypothetical protein